MQNQIKIPLYGACILLLILSIATVKSCLTQTPVFPTLKTITEIKDDSASYWKDAYGREHAQKEVAEAKYETIKAVYGPVIDSVLKGLKIQGKQMESLNIAGISNSNHVALSVDTIHKDSTTEYRFHYDDKWIKLAGIIGQNSALDYTTYDSLIITSYYKRSGFLGLGKKTSYVDAYSLNPHSHITGMQSIRIATEKPKRFGLGPYVGYGWNGRQWAPNIGFGLNFSILKF